MLGRLPKGSEAIIYQNTLFRISELCWIKAVRLSIPMIIFRVAALVLSVVWVMQMEKAKGTYYNVECLLAIFPLLLAWSTAGSLKIGCSGDFEEAYESRRGLQSSLFRSWIEALQKKEPQWLHLKSSDYDLLLNPNRVAWIRPCIQWRVFPLIVAAAFYGYIRLVNYGFNFEEYPILSDFHVLIFDQTGTIINLSYGMIVVALVIFGLSVRRSVEICGTGGVQDVFPLTAKDQKAVLGILAGNAPAQAAKPAPAPEPKKEPKKAPPAKPAPKPQAPTAPLAHSVTEELKVDAATVPDGN